MNRLPTRRLTGALPVLAALLVSAMALPQSRAAPPDQPPAGTLPPAGEKPQPPSSEEGTMKMGRNVPGDSKPLLLTADEFATWIDKGRRVILMRGQVLIQQSVARIRCDEAVAIVNLDRLQRTGVLHADVWCEGNLRVEDGKSDRKGPQALLDLNTRGELKIFSHKKKVLQQPIPDAPLFQRAIQEVYGPQPAPAIVPAGAKEVVRPVTPSAPKPVIAPPAPKPVAPSPPSSYVPTPPPQVPTPPGPGASIGPPPSVVRGSGRDLAPSVTRAQDARSMTVQAPPATPPGSPPGARGPRLLQPAPGEGPTRQYSVAPRTGNAFQLRSEMLSSGEQASIFTGGIIINVRTPDGGNLIDIEADNALVWSRGGDTTQMIENLRRPEGQTSRDLEFYFSGNVQVRSKGLDGDRLLQASEVYLDASRNVAIALSADLEMRRPGTTQPVHVRADELRQLSNTKFETLRTEIFASKLPSDPGLRLAFTRAVIEEQRVPKTTLFGNPVYDRQGNPLVEIQRPVEGKQARLILEDLPIFFLPRFKGDAADPFGPLENIRIGGNQIFGFQLGVSLDVYDLFGIQPQPSSRWRLDLDYLSSRGPALGTTFDSSSPTYFEMPAKVTTKVLAYGINDTGKDILGGGRDQNDNHPDFRERFLFRQNVQELPEGFIFQNQFSYLSDRNFLEQYYKNEFDNDINQSIFAYLQQTQGNYRWSILGEQRIRSWVTETSWLPRLDGDIVGLSFFDRLTYSANASVGYGHLQRSESPYAPYGPTDVNSGSVRLDLLQEVSLPFYAGPVKLAPYVVGDLTYYSSDLSQQSDGRAYGAVGMRGSLPFTRLFPEVKSVLHNVNGLMHKVVFTGNAYVAESTDSFLRYAQFDRLNDDASDQALRDIYPSQPSLNPSYAQTLRSTMLYDPQRYAIRRLIDNRIETRDDIEVVQLGMRQRLQTKRGFPGNQHIVDWMTLDLTGSFFPRADRDNFGSVASFLEYDYIWNVGDRTSLVSSGWFDPIENGARVWNVGAFLDRPDRTSFYVGYRQIDPLQSKAVSGSATYIFSPKYATTGSVTYDYGIGHSLNSSVVFTRMGADLNVGFGFTYNAFQNNFGLMFEIIPSLMQGKTMGASPLAGGGFMNR